MEMKREFELCVFESAPLLITFEPVVPAGPDMCHPQQHHHHNASPVPATSSESKTVVGSAALGNQMPHKMTKAFHFFYV